MGFFFVRDISFAYIYLEVSLVVVLVLKDGGGHLVHNVPVQVLLCLCEHEDGDATGGVDEESKHDEHAVGHMAFGLGRLQVGFSQRGLVAVLDKADDDANEQCWKSTKLIYVQN